MDTLPKYEIEYLKNDKYPEGIYCIWIYEPVEVRKLFGWKTVYKAIKIISTNSTLIGAKSTVQLLKEKDLIKFENSKTYEKKIVWSELDGNN